MLLRELPEVVQLPYGNHRYVDFQRVGHSDLVLAKLLRGKKPRTFKYSLLRYDPNYQYNLNYRVLGGINNCNRQRERKLNIWCGNEPWPAEANVFIDPDEWERGIEILKFLVKEVIK